MIFVSVGTHEAPFDRMLRAVYDLELEEELVVQYGPSTIRSERAWKPSTSRSTRSSEYIQQSRAVVMHAGVGSVMISLANGKRPIVMARRRSSASTWTTISSSLRGAWRRVGSSPSSTTVLRWRRRSQATVCLRGG